VKLLDQEARVEEIMHKKGKKKEENSSYLEMP
jgi:hypothetical protein